MAVTQPQPAALPEGLRYYLLRGNVMVPLIPADQLPFQLQGLPRQLTHRQMSDESWKLLQETEHVAKCLTIQAPSNIVTSQHTPVSKPRFLAPDHHARTDLKKAVEGAPIVSRLSLPLQSAEKAPENSSNSLVATQESPISLTDTFASIYQSDAQRLGYRMPYPSGIEPDQSKKEYCTHWIKTGECAFISVGCKYKHEMPTMEKLRELGFTQLPKWWKEKSAITSRGPTWMQRRLALNSDDDKDVSEMPPPREFPDPLVFRNKQANEYGVQREEKGLRGHLEKCASIDQGTASRLNPRLVPMSIARRESQVSNLLIDLEAPTTSPTSPQFSELSLNSGSASETGGPFTHESTPANCMPTSQRKPAATTTSFAPSQNCELKPRKEPTPPQPTIRRESLMSWSSDGEDDMPPIGSILKQKIHSQKPVRRLNTLPRPTGLAKSKHAVTNETPQIKEAHKQGVGGKTLQPKEDGVAANQKVDRIRCSSITRPAKRPRKTIVSAIKQTRT
jgi:hypothetical protein